MSEERIARLKEFIQQDPNDAFSYYALALEYAGQGDDREAIQLLEDLILRNPDYIPSYQQLGYLFQKAGRREDAVETFKRGIQRATRQGEVHAGTEMQDALDELQK